MNNDDVGAILFHKDSNGVHLIGVFDFALDFPKYSFTPSVKSSIYFYLGL